MGPGLKRRLISAFSVRFQVCVRVLRAAAVGYRRRLHNAHKTRKVSFRIYKTYESYESYVRDLKFEKRKDISRDVPKGPQISFPRGRGQTSMSVKGTSLENHKV